MAILKILTIPDQRLKHKSSDVKFFDEELKQTVNNMYETLYNSGNGIGLAAPQVNIRKRIVVIDLKEENKSAPITFINPKITEFSEAKFINQEGCLSVPEFYADVERSKEVLVEWFDEHGKKFNKKLSGLLSICIQHEIDHLDGILFIDYLSSLKRKMAVQKIKKLKKKKTRMNSLKELKVAFFGTPEFSLEFLKYLKLNKISISFIVTQPASQSGRGKKINKSPVEDWGIKNKIETFSPLKINDESFRNKIKDIKVDFIVVVAYGNLIDDFLINFPKFLTINIHASLLPKWRGAAPIQRSILNGDEETGVCIMKVVKKLDAGPIIQKKK